MRAAGSGPKALRVEETELLLAKVAADPIAVDKDIVDLVEFMLGAGVRLGEALEVLPGWWRTPRREAGDARVGGHLTCTFTNEIAIRLSRPSPQAVAGRSSSHREFADPGGEPFRMHADGEPLCLRHGLRGGVELVGLEVRLGQPRLV